jgi:hypothetical protein
LPRYGHFENLKKSEKSENRWPNFAQIKSICNFLQATRFPRFQGHSGAFSSKNGLKWAQNGPKRAQNRQKVKVAQFRPHLIYLQFPSSYVFSKKSAEKLLKNIAGCYSGFCRSAQKGPKNHKSALYRQGRL